MRSFRPRTRRGLWFRFWADCSRAFETGTVWVEAPSARTISTYMHTSAQQRFGVHGYVGRDQRSATSSQSRVGQSRDRDQF